MAINYSTNTVAQLKEICKERAIGISGNKTVLILRLNNYDKRIPDETWKKKALKLLANEKRIPWTGTKKEMYNKLLAPARQELPPARQQEPLRQLQIDEMFSITSTELQRQIAAFKQFEEMHKRSHIPDAQHLPGNNEDCSICLEKMDADSKCVQGKQCAHCFHETCIKKHFNRTIDYGHGDIRSLPPTCPLCRMLFI